MSSKAYHFPKIEVVSRARGEDGKRQPCATITCECGEVGERWLSGGFNEQATAKFFEGSGWNVQKATCPACMSKRRPAPPMVRLVVDDPQPASLTPPPPAPLPANVISISAPKKEQPVMSAETPTPTPTLRTLTPSERTKVRSALEAVFDEALGMYLEGATDQSIGLKLGLPWKLVADYREVAFGPIRENEETAKISGDLAALTVTLTEMERRYAADIREVKTQMVRLNERLTETRSKMGLK